jgi:hypothetical protein
LIKDIMTNQNSPKFERNILEGVEKEFDNWGS